jgi:hypothetical protein
MCLLDALSHGCCPHFTGLTSFLALPLALAIPRNSIEQAKKTGTANDTMFLAEIMAYQGKYQEAAKLFAKSGFLEKYVCSALHRHCVTACRRVAGTCV